MQQGGLNDIREMKGHAKGQRWGVSEEKKKTYLETNKLPHAGDLQYYGSIPSRVSDIGATKLAHSTMRRYT